MAQTAGFTCDLCGSFAAAVTNSSSTTAPIGWLGVRVQTEQGQRNQIDICSNKCLAELGAQRFFAETGRPFRSNALRERNTEARQRRRASTEASR